MEILTWAQRKTINLFPLFRKSFQMVFSMNVFKNKNVGKIKKTSKNVKKRALNKNVKNVFYIYGTVHRPMR